jgi:hypothetical protein
VLKSLRRRRLEAGERHPEVHIIGEIVGGTGFGTGITCKYVTNITNIGYMYPSSFFLCTVQVRFPSVSLRFPPFPSVSY